MFRFLTVRRGERIVHFVDGQPVSVYGPGRHTVWTLRGLHEFVVRKVDVASALAPVASDDRLPPDAPGLTEIEVGALERVAVLLDGKVVGVLGPGRYRWWSELGTPELRRFDLTLPPEPLVIDDPLNQPVDGAFTLHTYPAGAIWVRNGRYVKLLPPGRYRYWINGPWTLVDLPKDVVALGAEVYDPVPDGAHVESVGREERMVVFLDGVFVRAVGPGRYLWWDAAGRFELRRYSLLDEPTLLPPDDVVPAAAGCLEVAGDELQSAVLLRDGLPVRVLPVGRYRTWTGSRWAFKVVPRSLQSLDVAPQDLLTRDQIPIRLKAAVSVRVRDPIAVLSQPDWPNQVYSAVQLAMREVVTARELEPLLADRGPASEELLARARALLPDVGMALETASIKDVILPGEIRDLLNRVTLARKEAEALGIKRREETAATRQLANTARLLENNPVLMRLKELEALGDLAARIERITLVGSGDLVHQVLLSNLASKEMPPTEG